MKGHLKRRAVKFQVKGVDEVLDGAVFSDEGVEALGLFVQEVTLARLLVLVG